MKLLLAIDGSKFSEAATQAVITQVRPEDTEVRVLHVVEPIYSYTVPPTSTVYPELKDRLTWAGELVDRTVERLCAVGFKAMGSVEQGNAKSVILEQAGQWQADLIVLGSHGLRGLDRFLMGSVSEAVARHAPCSVEIVRIPEV